MSKRHYSDKEIREIVRRVEDGEAIIDVHFRTGIPQSTISSWRTRHLRDKARERLEKENEQLKEMLSRESPCADHERLEKENKQLKEMVGALHLELSRARKAS